MKKIIGLRGSGRTTELIRLSVQNGWTIVCPTIQEAHGVYKAAQEMGLMIPHPVSNDEFLTHLYRGKKIPGFLIDQTEQLLQSMTDVPVQAIVLDDDAATVEQNVLRKRLLLQWERYLYTDDTTIGKLYTVETNFVAQTQSLKTYFSFTLEDTVRPPDVKVMENTALPAGVLFKVAKFENAHYGRTIIFYTEPDQRTIRAGLLTWVGCLSHNGTNKDHTAGCLLVGNKLVDNKHISGGEKDDLAKLVWERLDTGWEVEAIAVNLPQLK